MPMPRDWRGGRASYQRSLDGHTVVYEQKRTKYIVVVVEDVSDLCWSTGEGLLKWSMMV